jgi:hypothetical protein
MKTRLVLFIILISAVFYNSSAQNTTFNLKNIDNLAIEVIDGRDLLSDRVQQKLTTELKIKLMSAGIKVTTRENATALLQIDVTVIKSSFAEHRILVKFNIYEDVITKRLDSTRTAAITYSDIQFFADKEIESGIYNKVMDSMILTFIERYLSSKF